MNQEKIKKIRRPKPRNKFIKEVMRYQREINFLIPKAPFRRVVREIAEKINPTIKFNERALQALQEASEAFIVGTMEDGVLCTIHASRVTLMKKDVELAKRIKGDPS
ncbi:histone H3 [Histomonas meleagridis]|nr:histone H3 [Histomonas meleagridis]